MSDRLYGVPSAERLYFDIATVYESDIEPYADDRDRLMSRKVEEFTIHPPRAHLPSADLVLDHIREYVSEWGEVTEDFESAFPMPSPAVEALCEALLDEIAAGVTFRMADQRVATHTITWDGAGQPLVNGEPLYRKSASTT